MAEARPSLTLVPDGHTTWRIEHSTANRIRIRANILTGQQGRCREFCRQLRQHNGVRRVSANARLGTATVHYSPRRLDTRHRDGLIQDALTQCLVPLPPPASGLTAGQDEGHLLALVGALAITPLLPPPLRLALTLGAISPTLLNSFSELRQGGSAKRVLDASALLLTTMAGRQGVAQINNLMHVLAHRLESAAIEATESRMRDHGRAPQAAYRIKRAGEVLSCDPPWLEVGDLIKLEEGELIPLEAVVTEGSGRLSVGFSSEERNVSEGDRVVAGSYLQSGTIELVCLQNWTEGVYARIASFIEIAIRSREDHQRYAAGLADRLVPLSAMLSAAVYGFTRDLGRASSALQADFTASYEMVTPVGVESTIAAGAAQGALFRSGPAIEDLAGIDTLVFDRSGTFTRTEWQLVKMESVGDNSQEQSRLDLSALVYHCCRTAVQSSTTGRLPPLSSLSHSEVQQIQQHGLHMSTGSRSLSLVVPSAARQRFNAVLPETITPLDRLGLLVCLLVNGECVALMRFSDELRQGNIEAIEALRHQGVEHVYLLSQEHVTNLHPELSQLPIDGFHTSLSEVEKLEFVRELLDQGRRVAVVSDGLFRGGSGCLNICLGSAADARPLDADLWLISGELLGLVTAHDLARRSHQQLKSSHRLSQAGRGAMLLASSFDLLPPSVAAALGNTATLAAIRMSRNVELGEVT